MARARKHSKFSIYNFMMILMGICDTKNLALEDSNRQILQTGRLLTPDESSDKLLELLVVLLDNSSRSLTPLKAQ
jgi:hypothetical protein